MTEHQEQDQLVLSGEDFRALHQKKQAEGCVHRLSGKDHNFTSIELDDRVYIVESDYVRINQRGNDEDVVLTWRPDLKPRGASAH
jgi:hypothetical protein